MTAAYEEITDKAMASTRKLRTDYINFVWVPVASWPVRPPMEQRGGADALRLALESSAAGQLRLLQLIDAGEMAVVERHVG